MSLQDRIVRISTRAAVPSLKAAADERRWATRKSGRVVATIISDRVAGRVGCVVRDVSATGARLVFDFGRGSAISSTRDLPNSFTLFLEREGVEVDCALAWTTEKAAGVHFLSNMRQVPKRVPIRMGPAKK